MHDTGCYADFTFPAAPDESQPAIVNQIYWPEGDLAQRRAYEQGTPARVGERHDDRLLMIEGPLALSLRPGRLLIPRIENAGGHRRGPGDAGARADLGPSGNRRGGAARVGLRQGPHPRRARSAGRVAARRGGDALHGELTTRYNDGRAGLLHYVTAREMYNIAIAAMDGCTGDPGAYRDYLLPPPPVAATAANAARGRAEGR